MSGDRIDRLWGCGDIDQLFAGGSAITTTPWQRGNKVRHGTAYDHDTVQQILTRIVELADIDPRHVRCSQPALLRIHVAHYLTDLWERTGRTSADQHAEHNRFPLVIRNHRGHDLVLAGHHRAAAALLEGRPVRARAISTTDAFCVTPLLRVDPAAPAVDPAHAVGQLEAGREVTVASLATAADVLTTIGASSTDVALAVELAARRLTPRRPGQSRRQDGLGPVQADREVGGLLGADLEGGSRG